MAVKKTKTGYQVQYYDADGRFRKRTFRGVSREDAVRKEREILAARDRGEDTPDPRRAPQFSTFADTWVEENRSRWKAGTLAENESIINSKLKPTFGNNRLSNITESNVLRFITKLRDEGLSPKRMAWPAPGSAMP